MSEASIPAWKRAGLKQAKQTPKQSDSAYDPLKEGLKRAHESGETSKPAKPAKRAKVPKAERPAPTHELDQLAYLRQFSEDRENWKFSKQKQNWILKHMFTEITDERYDQPLLAYIEGLMGSARNWVADDAKELINKWNQFMKEDLEKKEETEQAGESTDTNSSDKNASKSGQENKNTSNDTEDNTSKSGETSEETKNEDDKDNSNGEKKNKKKNKEKAQPAKPVNKVPSEKMVRRAQQIVKILTGETPSLEFLDNPSS